MDRETQLKVVDIASPGQIINMESGTYVVDQHGALRRISDKLTGKQRRQRSAEANARAKATA